MKHKNFTFTEQRVASISNYDTHQVRRAIMKLLYHEFFKDRPNAELVDFFYITNANAYAVDLYYKEAPREIRAVEEEVILEAEIDFDWSILPPWANKFIAKDGSGKWFSYSCKPKLDTICWAKDDLGCFILIHKDYIPKWEGRWQDSLFSNPGK